MGQSLVAGIVSGLISSVFLYVVLFRIKPKVKISDSICRDPKDGKFRVKVVNKTRANLIDVKYSLHACYKTDDDIKDLKEIELTKTRLEFISAYPINTNSCDYAIRVSFNPADEFRSDEHTYYIFTFFAKHSISGTPLFVRKEYAAKDIKCGQFETSDSTKVLLETCHSVYASCGMECLIKEKATADLG